MKRANNNGRNGTRNREREGPVQAGLAAEEEDEKVYVGRGYSEVLGGLHGGGRRYVLEHTIYVTSGTVDWSRR